MCICYNAPHIAQSGLLNVSTTRAYNTRQQNQNAQAAGENTLHHHYGKLPRHTTAAPGMTPELSSARGAVPKGTPSLLASSNERLAAVCGCWDVGSLVNANVNGRAMPNAQLGKNVTEADKLQHVYVCCMQYRHSLIIACKSA